MISSDQVWGHAGGARGGWVSRKGQVGRDALMSRSNVACWVWTGAFSTGTRVAADVVAGREKTWPRSGEIASPFSAQQQEMFSGE